MRQRAGRSTDRIVQSPRFRITVGIAGCGPPAILPAGGRSEWLQDRKRPLWPCGVGDQILRRFAGEFGAQFRLEDTVARWGGDEFVAIITGPENEGAARAERVRQAARGDFKITVDDETVSLMVDAAMGIVSWNGVESGLRLFARADKEMYWARRSAREMARA